MPKTTKEIIRESYFDKGLFFFKYNRLNFANDDKWVGQTWYSQDEVEQLRKELKDKFDINSDFIDQTDGGYINHRTIIDSVFVKVVNNKWGLI